MIPFNKPLNLKKSKRCIKKVIDDFRKTSGDGYYTGLINEWIENKFECKKSLLVTSGTHALELSALIMDIKKGDEVIMPSYTFSSTANAFVLRGAKIKFIDINPGTMNMNENLIERAITEKTKAIVPVHYAGVACNMNEIMKIADKYDLFVIEDAAQGFMAKYKNKYLGTIGDFGCYSFHESKNYSSGEGGALIINNKKFIKRAEIIRDAGTNRKQFYRGQVDAYTWRDIGSSYLLSELNAAFLYPQIKMARNIKSNRIKSWNRYYNNLSALQEKGFIQLAKIPDYGKHNAHIFYIKTKNIKQRKALINYLKKFNIQTVFHYIPLHNSKAGKKYGCFVGTDKYTSKESKKLLRLPLFYELKDKQIDYITNKIYKFYYKVI